MSRPKGIPSHMKGKKTGKLAWNNGVKRPFKATKYTELETIPEKDRNRARLLLKKYGLSLDAWNKMFVKQEGKCAICKRHQTELNKVLCVDHNHDTKQVRKLLCMECNIAVGYYETLLKKNMNDKIKEYLSDGN